MKFLKKLLTVLVFIIVLCIVFALVLVGMLFNNTDETPDYVQDVTSLNTEMNGLVELAMDNAATSHKIGLELSIEDINVILAAMINELKAEDITYIKSAYVKDVDGVFVLYAPINVKGVSTLFSSSVEISERNGQIVLNLDNISISKLRVTSFVSKTLLPMLMTEEDLENSFKQIGLNADIDFEDMSIAMNKSDCFALVKKQMDSTYEPLFNSLYEVIDSHDLLKVGVNNDLLELSVDVTQGLYNSLNNGVNSNSLDITSAQNNVKYMLNHSDFDSNNTDLLMKYLVFGYNTLTSAECQLVDSWDLSIINITDKVGYTPLKQIKNADITSSLLAQLTLVDLVSLLRQSSYSMKIDESTINEILYNMEIVGTTMSYTRYNHVTKEYDIATICINGLWMEIVDNQAYFNITIDVNGCTLALTLDLSNPTNTLLTLSNQVKTARLGEVDLTESETQGILTFLSQETSSLEWMEIDAENMSINFNFAKLMPQSSILQQIANFYTNREITYVGQNLTEDGYIQITYNK